jgi:hypothetical protein
MEAIFHNREDIEQALPRLYCVPTDNRDALLALGFQRMYPQVASGYESHLWVRSVDSGFASTLHNGRRLIMQRAYLEQRKGRSK